MYPVHALRARRTHRKHCITFRTRNLFSIELEMVEWYVRVVVRQAASSSIRLPVAEQTHAHTAAALFLPNHSASFRSFVRSLGWVRAMRVCRWPNSDKKYVTDFSNVLFKSHQSNTHLYFRIQRRMLPLPPFARHPHRQFVLAAVRCDAPLMPGC